MNRIAGKYAPIRKLTELSGENYLSYLLGSKGFRREVVLQILRPKLIPNIQARLQDAKLCARLSHTNIVQVIDLGQHEGLWFVASEYIDGWSLQDFLNICQKRKYRLPVPIIHYIMTEVLKGLAYAHRVKIITPQGKTGLFHHNIAPKNIMLDFHGAVKILGFSLYSKLPASSPFLPPEGNHNQRSDIFSCGVLLSQMLQHANGTPQSLQKAMQISEQAKNNDPQKRFHNAEAMLEAIVDDFSIPPTASGDLSILISQLQYAEDSLHTEEQPTMISMTIPLTLDEDFIEDPTVETKVTQENWESFDELHESTIVIPPKESAVPSWKIITAISVFFLTISGLFIGYFLGQRTMPIPAPSLQIFHPPDFTIKLNDATLKEAIKKQGLQLQEQHKLEVWDTNKHKYEFEFQLKTGENRIFLFPVYQEEVKPSKNK